MNRRTFAAALVVIIATAAYIHGQVRSVQGRITDGAGAPVAGVAVELILDDKPQATATTDPDGIFRFDLVDLSQGPHGLRLALPGQEVRTARLTAETEREVLTIGGYTAEIRSSRPATAAPGRGGATASGASHAIVPVFYATDRNRISYAPVAYGGNREPSKQLHLGRIDVSIPRDHKMGQLERPSFWTLWREDPNKHFVIVRGSELTYDAFYGGISEVVKESRRKEAFVFVHGFNVTFESAVYRTAQIAYDLNFDGAPILYSWPSVGQPTAYPVDLNNSDWTADRLHWFLEDVAARSGANYVHVIAHSRGNGPTMTALKAIATEPRTHPLPRFSQIILTAPDVDADAFRLLARAFSTLGERRTLYASGNDEALGLSKRYQGYQRAGDVKPEIVSLDGIDSIDVSAVDTSFLGHSYYGDNTSVISDIRRLLQTGSPPAARCGLEAVTDAVARYWRFVARAICPVHTP
ncbi:MAG TPA: alpha/beta hydrolase [Vicinamibacterales bacterium]|nr:alpha/beta hydrolase [Vicinamibacterales bacterium]